MSDEQASTPNWFTFHGEWPIGLILLLALGLRLALWSQPLHQPANDEVEYVTVAFDLLAGHGWQFYNSYHWLRAPLYPLFLAASLWLTGGNLHLAALPNIGLSVATVYLVYRLTMTLIPPSAPHRQPAACVAALLSALLFTWNTFASLYMSETLFTFLFTATLLLLVEKTMDDGPWTIHRSLSIIAAGLLFGLATLTRSATLAFLPVVLIWLMLPLHRSAQTGERLRGKLALFGRSLIIPALFGVCVGLTILPWTIRNCRAYAQCILVETGLAYNLWAFNEPHEQPDEIFAFLEQIPDPSTRAAEASRRGMQRLQEDPAILLRKLWPNWVHLWRVKIIQDRFLLADYAADPPAVLFLASLLLDDLLYGLILVAGVMGITQALLRRETAAPLLLLWLVYIVGTTMLTHGESRYRHFVFPVLMPYAAMQITGWCAMVRGFCPFRARGRGSWLSGYHWLIRFWSAQAMLAQPWEGGRDALPAPRGRDALSPRINQWYLSGVDFLRKRMRTPLLASWLLVGIWLYTFTLSYPWAWAAEGSRRSLHRLTGDIALARGDLARAVTAYRHALAVDKTPDGWLALGDVYRQQGDLDAAEAAYRKAWRQEIDYIPANVRLGDLLRTQGRSEEARTAFAGRYVAEQAVIDWSWRQLQPAPVTHIQVGDGLDFGYISGVYPAERLQGSMVRWTDGHARFRLSPAHNTPPETALVRLRLAAPHPGRDSVPAQICSTADCLPVELTSTWRIVTLQLPLEKDIHLDIHSPTFTAADGREVGVLVDWVLVDGDRPDSRGE